MSERAPERVTKGIFLAAWECDARGWYASRDPAPQTGFGAQWRFWVGHEVQREAQAWLGAGETLPRSPIETASEATQAALEAGTAPRLFEATFLAGALIARADALERVDGGWHLLEIKSGKSPEDGEDVKKEYVDDIAYTLMVARRAGVTIVGASLVLLNFEYRHGGADALFVRVDVTAAATARALEFDAEGTALAAAVLAPDRPAVELKFPCRQCDYYATACVGVGVPDPLWLLPRLSAKKFEVMRPFERISRLPEDVELTDPQRRVFEVIRSGTPRHDANALATLMAKVRWPVAYLDFETVNPALPWFAGSAAYEVVPFQYSLHVVAEPGATPSHHEYLAPLVGDWRRELLEQLLDDLGPTGSVVVYSSFERGRLKELAGRYPAYAERIEAVIARIFDLEDVFKQAYWHPGFAGRTSIKKVLPVMVQDEALSYTVLPVNNGDDALGLFGLLRVGEIDESLADTHQRDLLRYCKLDTLAMVRLHQAVAALL